jgi:ABC-2 type transport system permease protein
MNRTKKYKQAFLLGLQNSMAYRANFFLSLLSSMIPMIMQIFLWTAVFHNSREATVYGYSLSGMLSYVIIAAIVSKLVDTSVKWEIHGDIKEGGLSKYMIRPIGYLRFRVASFLGQKCPQTLVVLLALTISLMILSRFLPLALTPGRMLLFLAASVMALCLNLVIAFIVSAAAFWLTEAWSLYMISDVILLLVSGGVFPLELFGTTLKTILSCLPFQYTIYFPANILNGSLSYDKIAQGMALQLVWIFVLTVINNFVWKTGQKKYVAVGG